MQLGTDALARIEALEADNFALAAGLCQHQYGDEHGHSRCKRIDELEAQIADINDIEILGAAFIIERMRNEIYAARANLASSKGEHVTQIAAAREETK